MDSITYRIKSGHGSVYVTVAHEAGTAREVFIQIGHAGSCEKGDAEAIGRLCATALKYGAPLEELADQLAFIRCTHQLWDAGTLVKSVPDAVAIALKRFLAEHGGRGEQVGVPAKPKLPSTKGEEAEVSEEVANAS